MSEPLDYRKLVQVIHDVQAMGDKIFHPSTVHKPAVSTNAPSVRDNVAEFYVTFQWSIPRRDEWAQGDKRCWTRVKNIEQFLTKLEKATEGADLQYGIDWREVEFGVKGDNGLTMYVSFWVTAAPAYVWARQQQEPPA